MRKGTLTITQIASPTDIPYLSREDQVSGNDFTVCHKQLVNKEIHFFIASNTWEKLVIELHNNILTEEIPHMLPAFSTVELAYKEPPSEKVISLLCEMFPDKAGTIRRYFLMGKDVREVI